MSDPGAPRVLVSEPMMRDVLLAHLRPLLPDLTDDQRVPRHQIFLLGGNPLPVRVAMAALAPRVAWLVRTPEVHPETVDALKTQVERLGVAVNVVACADARKTVAIDRAIDEILGQVGADEVGLHYTGGTKAMSQRAAVRLDRHRRGREHAATYLDGREDALHFDGIDAPVGVGSIPVDLDEMLALHRATRKPDEAPSARQVALARRIAHLWFEEGRQKEWLEALPPWLEQRVRVPAGLIRPELPGEVVLEQCRPSADPNFRRSGPFGAWPTDRIAALLGDAMPAGAPTLEALAERREPKKATQWLATNWLEDHVRAAIIGFDEQWRGRIDRFLGGTDNEQDLLLRGGHRAVGVSVTTYSKKAGVKQKAFESLHWVSRLAGDHAVSVTVCLADEKVRREVWADLGEHWSGPQPIRLLGVEHLRGDREGLFTHVDTDGNAVRQTFEQAFAELARRRS